MSMQSKLLLGEARSWLEKVRGRKGGERKKREEKTKSGIIEGYSETGKSGGKAAELQLNEEDTTHRSRPG